MATVRVSFPNITIPRVDPKTGLPNPIWYRFDETMFKRTGGLNGDRTASVEVRLTTAEDTLAPIPGEITALNTAVALKADKTITATAGNGLTGGGTLAANFTFAAVKNTGWTASSGTSNKGAYATYGGQTVSAAYVQAEAQATDDAVKALSQRVKALEDALRSNGAIN